ncbi:putative methyltransferase DDB_G0268948 [Takifugu flavidus]|nr:putative methyltransferase DDB_G0268948 [Takifugu flavidus]
MYRLFDGKDHAFIYHKYRIPPPEEVKNLILQYLEKKKGQPHVLAVDLGCGTGQLSRVLAPHFQEVVGIDVSESQLEQARAVPGYPNITYREGSAEDLPVPDGSVDLLTASSAAHWFDQSRFLAEANRVLKVGGCIALLDYILSNSRLHYQDCGDRLTHIFKEVKQDLMPHTSSPVAASQSKLQDLFTAIPFPDKERIDAIRVNTSISVRDLTGLIETWSMFQTFKKKHPQEAEDLLISTQKRLLKEMGAMSLDTEIGHEMEYFCILASKP